MNIRSGIEMRLVIIIFIKTQFPFLFYHIYLFLGVSENMMLTLQMLQEKKSLF